MRLKKVTLNNYRCFEHLELDLHPRLTVLVGENGAGKTAVLDGIATGLSPVLTYLSTANQRLTGRGIRDEDFRVLPPNESGKSKVTTVANYAQIIIQAWDELTWDVWRPSAQGYEPAEKFGSTDLKHRVQAILESFQREKHDPVPVVAYYGTRRGFVEVPERLRSSKENYGYPTAALIGALDAMSDFREVLKWFDQEEVRELRSRELSPCMHAVRVVVKELLGGEFSYPHFNKDHKFVVRRNSTNQEVKVGQLSQGYQSMLALAMDFSRRLGVASANADESEGYIAGIEHLLGDRDPVEDGKWVQDIFAETLSDQNQQAPSLMLIDEIDLHLHPTWQQRVLGDLMRTFPLTQFIVTTHSPQVLSTVPRECIRILRQTETGYEAVLPDFSPLAHESGEALARVMGTHNPPSSPLLDKVHEFEQLVLAGQESSERAQALHQELDQAGYQFMDSDLHTWRVLAKHRTSKLKA